MGYRIDRPRDHVGDEDPEADDVDHQKLIISARVR
jgi:hypothetical protein